MMFSIIILSHSRPILLKQAVDSVNMQTVQADDILIVDSGALMAECHKYCVNSHTRMIATGETDEIKKSIHIPSWVLNKFTRLLFGEWIVTLCDDDLLLPFFLESLANYVSPTIHPSCFYTGQFRTRCDEFGGNQQLLASIPADRIRGAGDMCHIIDYLQFVFNRPMWTELCNIHSGCPVPEGMEYSRYADGVFMERAVAISKAIPVPGFNCVNRRTPVSKFLGP